MPSTEIIFQIDAVSKIEKKSECFDCLIKINKINILYKNKKTSDFQRT